MSDPKRVAECRYGPGADQAAGDDESSRTPKAAGRVRSLRQTDGGEMSEA